MFDAVTFSHIELLVKWEGAGDAYWVNLSDVYLMNDIDIRRYFRRHNL
jgi:hypothetical protein